MNEGIVMHLSSAADRWERTHPIIGLGELRVHDALRDAVRCIKETSAKVPKWISVEERLPESAGKYIVCTKKRAVYCTAFRFFHGKGYFATDSTTHITHWMPLPEAPKGDA